MTRHYVSHLLGACRLAVQRAGGRAAGTSCRWPVAVEQDQHAEVQALGPARAYLGLGGCLVSDLVPREPFPVEGMRAP